MIPKGARYLRQFCVDGGDAWTWISHEDCHEAALYLFDQDGGCWGDNLTPLYDYENATGEFPDHIRGRWPHVICRLEFNQQMAEARYQERIRALGMSTDQGSES